MSTYGQWRTIVAVVLVLEAAGCGGSSSSDRADAAPLPDAGIRLVNLEGTWVASSHTFTNKADSAEVYELITGSGSTRMTVLDGGRARTFVTSGDGTIDEAYDALLFISGDTMTQTTDESPVRVWSWKITLVDGTMTLISDAETFDFTRTGAAGVAAIEKRVFSIN